jgi:hypothetical protein
LFRLPGIEHDAKKLSWMREAGKGAISPSALTRN